MSRATIRGTLKKILHVGNTAALGSNRPRVARGIVERNAWRVV